MLQDHSVWSTLRTIRRLYYAGALYLTHSHSVQHRQLFFEIEHENNVCIHSSIFNLLELAVMINLHKILLISPVSTL